MSLVWTPKGWPSLCTAGTRQPPGLPTRLPVQGHVQGRPRPNSGRACALPRSLPMWPAFRGLSVRCSLGRSGGSGLPPAVAPLAQGSRGEGVQAGVWSQSAQPAPGSHAGGPQSRLCRSASWQPGPRKQVRFPPCSGAQNQGSLYAHTENEGTMSELLGFTPRGLPRFRGRRRVSAGSLLRSVS